MDDQKDTETGEKNTESDGKKTDKSTDTKSDESKAENFDDIIDEIQGSESEYELPIIFYDQEGNRAIELPEV